MQITHETGNRMPTDLIPSGFLCWALLAFKGMKCSKETDGRYGEIDLIVTDSQQFARKHVFELVCDPDDGRNSEAWRQMGMASLTRMIECAGFVNPADPASYQKVSGYTCEQVLQALDGKQVAIRVKIEKGGDGYQDKNKVGDYLTPNPSSSGNKGYTKLKMGDNGLTQQAVGKSSGFGQALQGAPGAATPPHQGVAQQLPFGQALQPAQRPPLQGFGQPGPASATQPAAASGFAATPSPSNPQSGFDPNRAPGWMKPPG